MTPATSPTVPHWRDYPRFIWNALLDAVEGNWIFYVWIEKGMGMVIPGFVPSVLHEVVEYSPSLLEWKIMAGIWALGLMIYTLAIKIAINVFRRSPLAAKPGGSQNSPQPLAS